MRSAKDRKHNKKQIIKRNKSMRTEKARQRSIDNGHIRTHFKSIEPDLRFKLIDGTIYTYTNKLNNHIIPSALPEGAIKTECDIAPIIHSHTPIFGEDGHMIDYSQDEHEGAEELAEYEDEVLGMSDKSQHVDVLDAETGEVVSIGAVDMKGWTNIVKGWVKKGWMK